LFLILDFDFDFDFDFDSDFDLKRKRLRILKKMLKTIVGKHFEKTFGPDLAGVVGAFSGNEPPAWQKPFPERFRLLVDGCLKDDDFYKELSRIIDGKAFGLSNAGSTPTKTVWEFRVSITPNNIAAIMKKKFPVVFGLCENEPWHLEGFFDNKRVVLKNPSNNKIKTVILKEGKLILAVRFEREPRYSEMGA
jgi:hypothetical protein